jgi:hypothetical protein
VREDICSVDASLLLPPPPPHIIRPGDRRRVISKGIILFIDTISENLLFGIKNNYV